MLNKLFIVIIGIVFVGCENNDGIYIDETTKLVVTKKGDAEIVVSGEDFKTKQANELNSEGIELSQKGSPALARKKFLEALELEPKNATILNSLGIAEMQLQHYKKSIKYFEEALILSDSTYVNSAINLGLSYYYNQEDNKCLSLSDFAISNTNSQVHRGSAIMNKALAQVKLGLCEEASKNLILLKSIFANDDIAQMNQLEESIELCLEK